MSGNVDGVQRRLPVYLLVDCSGSMAGEPILAMQMGARSLVNDLINDPYAMDTVWLSVITFGSTADQLVPLCEIGQFQMPNLEASGTTALGDALEVLMECVAAEVRPTTEGRRGDWRPHVFLFTDGKPTDAWLEAIQRFKASDQATLMVCGAGPEVNDEALGQMSETVLHLNDTRPGTLGALLKWVNQSVT